MSRHQARRQVRGSQLRAEMAEAGIEVRADSDRGLAEETPAAYKDVDEVVMTCERAGLARRVARLRPVGVIKG
jgi:tRNA-splicing ligase RtcB